MDHKKQHFVPQSYLKAWCDPGTPAGQEPYVWCFTKDGQKARRRSPRNIFYETDLYTIQLPDRQRELTIEKRLSQLEQEFVDVRSRYFDQKRKVKPSRMALVCAFVAAMKERTPWRRDWLAEMWGELLASGDRMREWASTATPEQLRAAGAVSPPEPSKGLSYDEVKALAELPLQSHLMPAVRVLTTMLMHLDCAIITSDGSERFITSDDPCVWADLEAYKRPPLYQGVGPAYRSIEITMPLSPRQLIMFNRQGLNGYLTAGKGLVQEFNRRTRFECEECFICDSNAINQYWFDPGAEPADSSQRRDGEPISPQPEADDA